MALSNEINLITETPATDECVSLVILPCFRYRGKRMLPHHRQPGYLIVIGHWWGTGGALVGHWRKNNQQK